eukprot:IDg7595t1
MVSGDSAAGPAAADSTFAAITGSALAASADDDVVFPFRCARTETVYYLLNRCSRIQAVCFSYLDHLSADVRGFVNWVSFEALMRLTNGDLLAGTSGLTAELPHGEHALVEVSAMAAHLLHYFLVLDARMRADLRYGVAIVYKTLASALSGRPATGPSSGCAELPRPVLPRYG